MILTTTTVTLPCCTWAVPLCSTSLQSPSACPAPPWPPCSLKRAESGWWAAGGPPTREAPPCASSWRSGCPLSAWRHVSSQQTDWSPITCSAQVTTLRLRTPAKGTVVALSQCLTTTLGFSWGLSAGERAVPKEEDTVCTQEYPTTSPGLKRLLKAWQIQKTFALTFLNPTSKTRDRSTVTGFQRKMLHPSCPWWCKIKTLSLRLPHRVQLFSQVRLTKILMCNKELFCKYQRRQLQLFLMSVPINQKKLPLSQAYCCITVVLCVNSICGRGTSPSVLKHRAEHSR